MTTSEWKGLWKCKECGKTGPSSWAEMVNKRGYHYASDDTPECYGALIPYDRRTPDPRVAALREALRHTQFRLKTQTQMPFYRYGERWFVTDFTKEQLEGNIAYMLAEVETVLMEESRG